MPCCTYLTDGMVEFEKENLTDKDIIKLLDELNYKTSKEWVVRQRSWYTGIWKWKKNVYSFQILVHITNGEYQIINFTPSDERDWTINHWVDKRTLCAYIYGYLGGLNQKEKNENSS